MECDQCGSNLAGLPYTCKLCGENFCSKHRLPESHDCQQLKIEKAERALKREAGKDAGPWFDHDSDNSTVDESGHTAGVRRGNTTSRLTKYLVIMLLLILLSGLAVGVYNLL